MKDVMLDLETFGTRYNAMIISIGACYFDRMTGEVGETFFRNVQPGEHENKFTTDYSTIRWWLEQSEEARAAICNGAAYIEDALQDLCKFLDTTDRVLVWSHATFDMPILMNAFETLDILPPIGFRDMRDLRTLMDLANLDKMKRERFGVHHNALDDAKFQASYASDAFVKLNHGTA